MEGLKVQVAPSGNLERVWLSGWLDPFSVPISASESHANEINLGAETGKGEFGVLPPLDYRGQQEMLKLSSTSESIVNGLCSRS